MRTTRLKIGLVGGFEVRDVVGEERAPRSAKARALLALLCLAPDRRRPRRWIEDKLWSDRGAAQAGSSLRQALTQIRRALGPNADLLLTDRESVALSDEVATDLENEHEAAMQRLGAGEQLLEGFDIRDPEFEAWLRDQRSRLTPPAAEARVQAEPTPEDSCGRLSEAEGDRDGLQKFLAQALADQIAELVSDLAVVQVYSPTMAEVFIGTPDQGLRQKVYTISDGALAQVMVRLESTPARQLLWSRRIAFTDFGAQDIGSDAFYQIAFEAAEAMTAAMPRTLDPDMSRTRAHALALEGVREMFTFDPARLRHADDLFVAAYDAAPAPVYDAWRALLKTVMAVERNEMSAQALRAQADELARRALEHGYSNATVLGLVSQVRLTLDSDPTAGAMLATDARSRTSGNAFAEMAAAAAHMRSGQHGDSLRLALRATTIARNSLIRHWWEMSCCLAQIANGQYREAIRSAEAAHVRAPRFKPPLRHLYALYTYFGEDENARRVAARLKELEPDFSLRRIREDPDFPATVIRNTPLLHLPDVAS